MKLLLRALTPLSTCRRTTLTRRTMLKAVGLSSLSTMTKLLPFPVLTTAATTPALPESRQRPLFHIKQVAENVYAAIARPTTKENCNAAIITCPTHVLVVDTHSKPSAAQALLRQIRKEITDRPVRYLVNTHFHWDHVQGNSSYLQAFGSQVELLSSTVTREWAAREGVSRLRQSLARLPEQIAHLRAQGEAGTTKQRERISAAIAELEAYGKEMESPEAIVVLPTATFDRRITLYQGGEEVQLIFFGRGHTAGDIVVFLPRRKVLVTGDLVDSALPYIRDGYPDEWPRTLAALERLDFQRVISGHGSLQTGKSVLQFYRAYLEELSETVARGREQGVTLEALQRHLTPDRLRAFRLSGQQQRLLREASAMGATTPKRVIAEAVAENVAEVYAYFAKPQ